MSRGLETARLLPAGLNPAWITHGVRGDDQAQPFSERLRALAAERGTSVERVGTAAYDPAVEGTSLGMLRKVIGGQRAPNRALIEAVATALSVHPDEFAEYRLLVARESLDERVVGLDAALDQLRRIESALEERGARRAVTPAPGSDQRPAAAKRARHSRGD